MVPIQTAASKGSGHQSNWRPRERVGTTLIILGRFRRVAKILVSLWARSLDPYSAVAVGGTPIGFEPRNAEGTLTNPAPLTTSLATWD